ncbi:MAG TPA: hypothetical protein VFH22_01425 [Rhodocyclaceae bacterium]|nr:hypothetical protein [Rhodocyclaceae bacterium]
MKRVLYAWEMGAGLGHVAAFLPIASALRAQDCEIVCAVRDTGTAAPLLSTRRIPWLQAPFLSETPVSAPLQSYTDILLRHGFADADRLLGHVGAWLSIFELYRPQVLVADHAPAALLAARIASLPTMLFGTGFCCPPASTPMLSLRPWEKPDHEALVRSEETARRTMAQVAGVLGGPAPNSVGELVAAEESTVLGFPEVDHYPERARILPQARYWGVIGDAGVGQKPQWPAQPGRRLFAYVRPAYPHLDALFSALIELGLPSIVYCPGLDPQRQAALRQHAHLNVASAPLDLSIVFAEADAAVTNGSFSSSTGFLQAGKPVLVLPTQLEQFLFGWRVEQNEIGLVAASERPPTDLLSRLYRVANDPVIRQNAAAFAARYRDFDQQHVVGNIVQRIGALAGDAR